VLSYPTPAFLETLEVAGISFEDAVADRQAASDDHNRRETALYAQSLERKALAHVDARTSALSPETIRRHSVCGEDWSRKRARFWKRPRTGRRKGRGRCRQNRRSWNFRPHSINGSTTRRKDARHGTFTTFRRREHSQDSEYPCALRRVPRYSSSRCDRRLRGQRLCVPVNGRGQT